MGKLHSLTENEKNIFNNGFLYVQNASAISGFFSVKNPKDGGYTLQHVAISDNIAHDMNNLREHMISAFLNPYDSNLTDKGYTPRTFLSYLLTIGPTAARAFFQDVDTARSSDL